MTDLEARLGGLLSGVHPGPVDALAAGAGRYAVRARRQVALGVVAARAATTVAVGGIIELTSRHRAPVPGTPTPGRATVLPVELCSRAGIDLPARSGLLSQDFTAIALCPENPSAPEWRLAGTSTVVTGRAVDLVVLDRDEPSAATCPHTAPFPEMRIVLQSRTGEIMAVHGPQLRCGGRVATQSLYAAVAESRLPPADLDESPCWPAYPPFPASGRGVLPSAGELTSLTVCAHPSPTEGEVDAVPHAAPVLGFTPSTAEQATMLRGLRSGRMASGPRDGCPWVGLRIVVRMQTSDGAVSEEHLHCDQLPEGVGQPASWFELPEDAWRVLQPLLDEARGLSAGLAEP